MSTINILGISPTINCSASLFKDGVLVAMAEEERFNRIKTGGGGLPINAVKYCLSEGGISLKDIDYIAVSWDCTKYPELMDKFNEELNMERNKYSSFFLTNFRDNNRKRISFDLVYKFLNHIYINKINSGNTNGRLFT